ncbi:uncharacterized protein RAG0_09342 [Rhynchosporium agropyri]|uniref:Uncharacterized protein n=1 Tax=Rhynchosporium agropyri TaxID=914238 RepID=A0A1E1KV29_9HELO|nr:uncharacterized protein RAG0_09342 [Rhynchosporium agropyri]
MLSTYNIQTAQRSCWVHSLIADTNCLTCESDLLSTLQTYTYPSPDDSAGSYPYPASIAVPFSQILSSKPLFNTRISKLATDYCRPLQTIHDSYPERYALSPEEDPYSERFALSPKTDVRPWMAYDGRIIVRRGKGKRNLKMKRLLPKPKEEGPIGVPRGRVSQAIEKVDERASRNGGRGEGKEILETLPEESEDDDPIHLPRSRSSHAKEYQAKETQAKEIQAKEMDEKVTRLTHETAKLEESVEKLKAEANKLKLKARRQGKAGASSAPNTDKETSSPARLRRSATRGTPREDTPETVEAPRKAQRQRKVGRGRSPKRRSGDRKSLIVVLATRGEGKQVEASRRTLRQRTPVNYAE